MKTFLFSILFLMFVICGASQPPVLSQSVLTATYTTPAASGANPGLRTYLVHRHQWLAIDKPYITDFLSGDIRIWKKMGAGLKIQNQFEGASRMRTTQAHISVAYHTPASIISLMPQSGPLHDNFHLGLDIGYVQRGVDESNLIYSDQIDPALGVVSSSSTGSQDFNGYYGISWRFGTAYTTGEELRMVRFLAGWSWQNGVALRRSFLRKPGVIASNIHSFHGKMLFDITEWYNKHTWSLKAQHSLILDTRFYGSFSKEGEKQSEEPDFRICEVSASYVYNWVLFGLGLRVSDQSAVVGYIGLSKELNDNLYLQFVYSHDLALSSQFSQTVGSTHEISIRMNNPLVGKRLQQGKNRCSTYSTGDYIPFL